MSHAEPDTDTDTDTDTEPNQDDDTGDDLADDLGDEDTDDVDEGDELDAGGEHVDDEDLDSDIDINIEDTEAAEDAEDRALADDVDQDQYGDDNAEPGDELDTGQSDEPPARVQAIDDPASETDATSGDVAVVNTAFVAQKNSTPEMVDTNQLDAAKTPTTTTTLDVRTPEAVVDVVFQFIYAPTPPSKAPLAVLVWTLLAPVRTLIWTALAVTNNISRATADTFSVAAGGAPHTFTAAELTGNDLSPRGRPLSIYSVGDAVNGTVELNPDGTVTFTPTPGNTGTARFAYRPQDNVGVIGTKATVTLTGTHHQPPVIDAVTTTAGHGNTWTVKVDAHDVDHRLVSIDVVSDQLTVTRNLDGTFTATADPAWAAAHPGTVVLVDVTARVGALTTSTEVPVGTLNNAMAIGAEAGKFTIPALPAKSLPDGTDVPVVYTAAAVGKNQLVLLRSDGTAIAVGHSDYEPFVIPPAPTGLTYTGVATASERAVLLRSFGTATAVGFWGTITIPDPPAGLTYTGVATGTNHTVLLRSDGTAVAIGDDSAGQITIPPAPAGTSYTRVAAGAAHTVLLRSDGRAIAFGDNTFGQTDIPPLPPNVTYTGIAAGLNHTVLLRSDGSAIAVGWNNAGQIDIPVPPAGVTYTSAAAGPYDTVLLRSDGTAIAVGVDSTGPVSIPTLPTGVKYIGAATGSIVTVMLTQNT